MMARALLTFVLCAALIAAAWQPAEALEGDFGIGSKAPALDIEHWVQDGNGFFKPVTEFKSGTVYVVEFWATWCGPCIMSMPHLAELQKKYRGEKVQIVSVSDESLDEVKHLLAQKNDDEGKTFEEITSAYSLTTDPDRSVHTDYMEAAGEQGIPTSFIVGKSGIIEWIGHPMELDEPLAKVVDETWDREEYKEIRVAKQVFQESMQKIAMLAGADKLDDAIEFVKKQSALPAQKSMKDDWESVLNGLKLAHGKIDEEVLAYFRAAIDERKGDAQAMAGFGYQMYGAIQRSGTIGPLADDSIKAMQAELEDAKDEVKPMLYNAIALLHDGTENTQAAIKAQSQAVKHSANPRQKERLQELLDELVKKASGDEDEE